MIAPATAHAKVTGLADDHLELLSKEGADILQYQTPVENARLLVGVGTPATNIQVKYWMFQVKLLGWSPMIAISLPKGTKPASQKSYIEWLTGFLSAYPQIEAVEATNEPELTSISAPRAVLQYRATKRAIKKAAAKRAKNAAKLGVKAPNVITLAGGFSDRLDKDSYVKRYVKLLHEPNALWALHFYKAVIHNSYEAVQKRIKLVGAKKYWITETGVFTELKHKFYNRVQQLKQAQFVRKISNDKRAVRTYYMGGESCIGCKPRLPPPPLPAGAPLPVDPRLPVQLPPDNGLSWKTHIFENGVVTREPVMDTVFS